jgi:hypothetical protein
VNSVLSQNALPELRGSKRGRGRRQGSLAATVVVSIFEV